MSFFLLMFYSCITAGIVLFFRKVDVHVTMEDLHEEEKNVV